MFEVLREYRQSELQFYSRSLLLAPTHRFLQTVLLCALTNGRSEERKQERKAENESKRTNYLLVVRQRLAVTRQRVGPVLSHAPLLR